jgi:hypothetical protein
LKWKCRKRLFSIREDLHDPIKEALGPVYVARFEETPFAKYGGLPGTTARLKDWFRTLAEMINAGFVAPDLVSLVLCYLCAPTTKRMSSSSNASSPESHASAVSSKPARPASASSADVASVELRPAALRPADTLDRPDSPQTDRLPAGGLQACTEALSSDERSLGDQSADTLSGDSHVAEAWSASPSVGWREASKSSETHERRPDAQGKLLNL